MKIATPAAFSNSNTLFAAGRLNHCVTYLLVSYFCDVVHFIYVAKRTWTVDVYRSRVTAAVMQRMYQPQQQRTRVWI